MVEIIKYDYDGDWIIAMVRFEQKVYRGHILQANALCENGINGGRILQLYAYRTPIEFNNGRIVAKAREDICAFNEFWRVPPTGSAGKAISKEFIKLFS